MGLTQIFLDSLTNEQLVQRLDLALEGANLGIWDWDLRDNSVQFDRRWCEMLGLDHATTPMVLETWSSRVHPEDIDACYREVTAHVEGRTTRYENVHRIRHADGSWRHILDRGRISGRDEDGRPIRFTGTHFEVTEMERARERLRLEEESRVATLARFAATLAHELNTPLQVIKIGADLLASRVADDPAQSDAVRDSVRAIAEMGRRAGAITRALRTLSRDARNDPEEPVPVATMLTLALDLSRSRFDSRGVSLTVEDLTDGGTIAGRPSEVLRALLLLLDNAFDAARLAAPWVRLEATRAGERIILRCCDGGPGVAAEDVPSLGVPFFTTKPEGHGLGVGLSIIRSIAERGRGELAYVPDAPHTTFELRMPVAVDEVAT